MLGDSDLDQAASQLANYRRDDALPDILDKYATLIEDFRRLKSDYEEERDAREKYKQMAKGQGRNPFVLLLVDGDGYVFRDNLVSRKEDGGSNAAQILNEAIKDSLRRKGLEHCQVMVRIYANVVGLSKTLSKTGLAGPEKRSLAPFIANFNRSYGLCEFIDAGELKENADFKLRALMHLYAENTQCQHIYFAACHDAGYIADLTPYKGNSGRFTLINTPGIRFHQEFTKLGMGIEELPGVFRTTPLDGVPLSRPSYPTSTSTKATPANTHVASPVDETASTDGQKPCRFYPLGKCKYGRACKNLHVDTRSYNNSTWRNQVKDSQSDANGSPQEWEGKSSTLFNMRQTTDTDFMNGKNTNASLDWREILKLPKKEDIPPGHVALNKNEHRLDPYIVPSAPDIISRLRTRVNKQRLCNNYHLKGHCDAGNSCPYNHEPLNAELKRALESLAYTHPCHRRGGCRFETCTSGHICQNQDCKRRGGKANCKMPYLSHNEDFLVARYAPAVSKTSQSMRTSSVKDGSSVNGDDLRVNSLSLLEDHDDEESGSNGGLVEDDGYASPLSID